MQIVLNNNFDGCITTSSEGGGGIFFLKVTVSISDNLNCFPYQTYVFRDKLETRLFQGVGYIVVIDVPKLKCTVVCCVV